LKFQENAVENGPYTKKRFNFAVFQRLFARKKERKRWEKGKPYTPLGPPPTATPEKPRDDPARRLSTAKG